MHSAPQFTPLNAAFAEPNAHEDSATSLAVLSCHLKASW